MPRAYEGDVFDYVAVYLIPEDLFYIIPAEKVQGQGSVALYPRLKSSKYEKYREAWELLKSEVVESIQACAGFEAPAARGALVNASW